MTRAEARQPPIIVIPARIGSTRLPGKMLRTIAGRPLIEHTISAVQGAGFDVLVATDDSGVVDTVEAAGGQATMTAADHTSGTDRIAEIATRHDWDGRRIVVNVQGDEPLMPAALIRQVVSALEANLRADLSTAAAPIYDRDTWFSPNVVKVVCDNAGFAHYFSRAPIPYVRDSDSGQAPTLARHHIGIYGYRVEALKRLASAPCADLEQLEKLEQLRALAIGQCIIVVDACERPGPGVDVQTDLDAVECRLKQREAQ